MKLCDNKTPHIDFYNIHAFILAGMSNNKAELVKVNGYGAISANDEAANNFYIDFFTYVSYMLQYYV